MQSLSEQRLNHAIRSNVTEQDERYYKPLTDSNKLELLEEEHKRRLADEETIKAWHERLYEMQASRYDG